MKNEFRVDGDVAYVMTNRGVEFMVDVDDLSLIAEHRWSISSCGYVRTNLCVSSSRYKHLSLHRLLLNPPQYIPVDHIDGNPLNNTRKNLRVVTQSENLRNRRKKKLKSSYFLGVSYKSREQKWVAQIKVDGKNKHLGLFRTEHEAALAYDSAKRLYYPNTPIGGFNFPLDRG